MSDKLWPEFAALGAGSVAFWGTGLGLLVALGPRTWLSSLLVVLAAVLAFVGFFSVVLRIGRRLRDAMPEIRVLLALLNGLRAAQRNARTAEKVGR